MRDLTQITDKQCIDLMQEASNRFYHQAIFTGNHAFIEFAGLMNEYIKVCADAHDKGIDFRMASTHTGIRMPMAEHQIAYVLEKLECIYGVELLRKMAATG